MPIIGLPNREQVMTTVADAFDQILASITGFLYTEHKDDGTHENITADNVTLNEDGSLTLEDGSTLSVVDGVLTLTAKSKLVVKTTDGITTATRMTVGENPQSGQTGLETQLADAVSLQRLRLFPQGAYDPDANDTQAFLDPSDPSVSAPNYSVYRITGAGNIQGIYTSGFTPVAGQRGQILIAINDSGGNIGVRTLGTVTDEKQIFGGPVTVLDKGAVTFVYDVTNEGWQILSVWRPASISHGITFGGTVSAPLLDSTGNITCAGDFLGDGDLYEQNRSVAAGKWTTYTPTWTTSGTAPDLGTGGAIVGEYSRVGDTVFYCVQITLGTGFSFGTGTMGVTPPVAIDATNPVAQHQAGVIDASTFDLVPLSSALRTIGGTPMPSINQWSSPLVTITSTAPITFAAGDIIRVQGWYRAA